MCLIWIDRFTSTLCKIYKIITCNFLISLCKCLEVSFPKPNLGVVWRSAAGVFFSFFCLSLSSKGTLKRDDVKHQKNSQPYCKTAYLSWSMNPEILNPPGQDFQPSFHPKSLSEQECLRHLILHGADLDIRDNRGWSVGCLSGDGVTW